MAAVCRAELSIFSEKLEINAVRQVKQHPKLYEQISLADYDTSIVTPVFYGWFPRKIADILNTDILHMSRSSQMLLDWANTGREQSEKSHSIPEFDAALAHPATFGYILLDKKPVIKEDEESEIPLPDPKKCSPREYVEFYIFPILLPALEKMLIEAKVHKVFEKRRTKFNACDFLTSYLYSHNPNYNDREGIELEEIPFVKEILAVNPRPPIPLSLLLSDDEAATIIQAHYKGYQVRKEPEVQELRQYQREMRKEEFEINFKVEDFWHKHSM